MDHLFEVKKTQIQMIQDRGFEIEPDELEFLNLEYTPEFKVSRSALSRIYKREGKPALLVSYLEKSRDSKQISIDIVRTAIESARANKVKSLLVIIEIPLSAPAKKDLVISGLEFQIFSDQNLSYNPTRHVDTPRHELLSKEETEQKLKELKADLSKLLIIKASDPIVQYYNWPVGRVVRIYREDYGVSVLVPRMLNYRVITQ